MVPAKLHVQLVLDELHQGEPGVIQMKVYAVMYGGTSCRKKWKVNKGLNGPHVYQLLKSAPVKASLHPQKLPTVPQLCIH